MLLLMALLAAPQVWKAIRYRRDSAEAQTYYAVGARIKLGYGLTYVVLAAFLAVMTHDVHEQLQASAAVRGRD